MQRGVKMSAKRSKRVRSKGASIGSRVGFAWVAAAAGRCAICFGWVGWADEAGCRLPASKRLGAVTADASGTVATGSVGMGFGWVGASRWETLLSEAKCPGLVFLNVPGTRCPSGWAALPPPEFAGWECWLVWFSVILSDNGLRVEYCRSAHWMKPFAHWPQGNFALHYTVFSAIAKFFFNNFPKTRKILTSATKKMPTCRILPKMTPIPLGFSKGETISGNL